MAHIHAVLGPGGNNVPSSVITDGLKDLLEKGDSLALPWYGGQLSDGLEAVYDYVMDQEIPFTMFYTDRKPPAIFEAGKGEFAKTKDISKSLAQMASPGSSLLVLFPDDDEDISEVIFDFLDYGPGDVSVLDLTNGLIPISVDDSEEETDSPEEKEAEAEETEDSLAGFTREELEGLGLKLLKRAAANVAPGVTIDSKEQAIALILGEPPEEVVETPEPLVAPGVDRSAGSLLFQALEALRNEESSRKNSLAITKVEEAILWCGGVV